MKKLHKGEHPNLFSSPAIVTIVIIVISWKCRSVKCIMQTVETITIYKFSV